MQTKKLQVIGLGYIGLPTAALVASKGLAVVGVDVKTEVVSLINNGKVHIIEPDLDGLVNKVIKTGNLHAVSILEKADIHLISVPTPFKDGFQPDLIYIEKVLEKLIPLLEPGNLVILESTSPIGTTEKIAKKIFKTRKILHKNIYVAYCPERVLPGHILFELENNARIVGGIDNASSEKAAQFYSLFVKSEIVMTDSRTAEMCKLVENSFRDVNIAFANELSMISKKAGINVRKLIDLANKHPRVNILQPGTGVGGHCIAVDPWFLVSQFPDESKIISSARKVNNEKTQWVINEIIEIAKKFTIKTGKHPLIVLLGLAYKPDIDDIRVSPSIEVYRHLKKLFLVKAVEPNLEQFPDIDIISLEEAVDCADILVCLTAHKEFRQFPWKKKNIILDFCNGISESHAILDPLSSSY